MPAIADSLKSVASSVLRNNSALESWSLPDERAPCVVLFLQRLGDSVITASFVNALRKRYPEMPIDILGRPSLREVCGTFTSFREYFDIEFPLYKHHRRGISDLSQTLRTLQAVRRRKYSYCINLVGDVRENLVGWMTGAKWRIAPVWSPDHPFARKITPGNTPWITNRGIKISSEYSSYYQALRFMASQLGIGDFEWPRRLVQIEEVRKPVTIALHPGSSHPSKQWGTEKWKTLIRQLDARGYRTLLLGSPEEREYLLTEFGTEIRDLGIDVITSEVRRLASCLAESDLLVGMDSFSAHVAHSVGVPAVVMHGSSEVEVMNPPGSIGLSAAHLCDDFPCYYKYPCKDTAGAYRCSRGIETSSVLDAVLTLVKRGN